MDSTNGELKTFVSTSCMLKSEPSAQNLYIRSKGDDTYLEAGTSRSRLWGLLGLSVTELSSFTFSAFTCL